MKALVKIKKGYGNLELRDVPVPKVGPTDALIKVWGSGVCGTDLHIYHDVYTVYQPPLIIGHEFSGTVAEIGDQVKRVKKGDRVVCDLETMEGTVGNDVVNGAHAEYILLPAHLVHKLPDNVSLEEGVLVEPVVTVGHALLERAKISPADAIVVTGPGPIGLIAVQVAKLFSPQAVVLTGTRTDKLRLEVGSKVGADYTFYSDEDLVEKVMDLTKGKGADLVVEASGAEQAMQQAIQMTRPGRQIIVTGYYEQWVKIDLSLAVYNSIDIQPSWAWEGKTEVPIVRSTAGALSWERAIRILSLGKIQLKPLITHKLPLERWEEGFSLCEKKEGVKVILNPG